MVGIKIRNVCSWTALCLLFYPRNLNPISSQFSRVESEISLIHHQLSHNREEIEDQFYQRKHKSALSIGLKETEFNDLSWGLMSQCPHQKAALCLTCLTVC